MPKAEQFATVEDALEAIDALTVHQAIYTNTGRNKPTKKQEVDSLAARLEIDEAWTVRERLRAKLGDILAMTADKKLLREILGEEAD